MLFLQYFYAKIFLKNSFIENSYISVLTCEKTSRSTQKVSNLEQRMPYLCNFGL